MFPDRAAPGSLNRRHLIAPAAVAPLSAEARATELSDHVAVKLSEFDANRRQKLAEIQTSSGLTTLREHVCRTLMRVVGEFPARDADGHSSDRGVLAFGRLLDQPGS